MLGTSAVVRAGFADATAQAQRPSANLRQGLLLGGGVALGAAARGFVEQLEGRVGWMVTPRLGVFGTALAGEVLGWEIVSSHMEGAGLRVWLSPIWFVDARAGWVHAAARDEDEGPTRRTSGPGYLVGVGAEGLLSRVGADAHVGMLHTDHTTAVLFGLGLSYY